MATSQDLDAPLHEILKVLQDLQSYLKTPAHLNKKVANPYSFDAAMTNPVPISSPLLPKPPDPPDFNQSDFLSAIKAAPSNLTSKTSTSKFRRTYSCEEIYERMENGLCVFCEEKDTPGHYHLEHKNSQIFMIDCDDNPYSDYGDGFMQDAIPFEADAVNLGFGSEEKPVGDGKQILEAYVVLVTQVLDNFDGLSVQETGSSDAKGTNATQQLQLIHDIETVPEIDSIDEHGSIGLTDSILAADYVYRHKTLSRFQVPVSSLEPNRRYHNATLDVVEDLPPHLECGISTSDAFSCDLEFVLVNSLDEEELVTLDESSKSCLEKEFLLLNYGLSLIKNETGFYGNVEMFRNSFVVFKLDCICQVKNNRKKKQKWSKSWRFSFKRKSKSRKEVVMCVDLHESRKSQLASDFLLMNSGLYLGTILLHETEIPAFIGLRVARDLLGVCELNISMLTHYEQAAMKSHVKHRWKSKNLQTVSDFWVIHSSKFANALSNVAGDIEKQKVRSICGERTIHLFGYLESYDHEEESIKLMNVETMIMIDDEQPLERYDKESSGDEKLDSILKADCVNPQKLISQFQSRLSPKKHRKCGQFLRFKYKHNIRDQEKVFSCWEYKKHMMLLIYHGLNVKVLYGLIAMDVGAIVDELVGFVRHIVAVFPTESQFNFQGIHPHHSYGTTLKQWVLQVVFMQLNQGTFFLSFCKGPVCAQEKKKLRHAGADTKEGKNTFQGDGKAMLALAITKYVNLMLQLVAFGCALIGDENYSTYSWLLWMRFKAVGDQVHGVMVTLRRELKITENSLKKSESSYAIINIQLKKEAFIDPATPAFLAVSNVQEHESIIKRFAHRLNNTVTKIFVDWKLYPRDQAPLRVATLP